MNTKKKILMFSYSFPPIKGIGTLRNYNIAHQFQKHFEVKILSTKNRFRLPLENINVDEFDIAYLNTLDYKTIRGKKNLNATSGSSEPSGTSWKVVLIRKLINSFPFNLFFGEGGLIYILHGLFLSRKYYKKGYHTMYSSFRPISDHYLAYLSKLFHKKRLWIADYRDLPYYDEVDKVFLMPKFQVYLLKKIIKKADYVVTISEGLKAFFEQYNNHVIVLRNGMSNLIERKKNYKKLDKFTITYTGTLYSGRRDPSVLFSVLEKLIDNNKLDKADLKLVYAGKEGALWQSLAEKYNLSKTVNNLGMLPIQDAVTLQYNTHINLLLTWCTQEQKGILTGKFFEYLNARKAIVLFISGEKDVEFEKIMNDLEIGMVAYENNQKELEDFVMSKYSEWKNTSEVLEQLNESKLKEFTWEHQFQDFYQQIDFR